MQCTKAVYLRKAFAKKKLNFMKLFHKSVVKREKVQFTVWSGSSLSFSLITVVILILRCLPVLTVEQKLGGSAKLCSIRGRALATDT